MIEKDIRKLLDIVEEKSVESTQLNESKSNLQVMVEGLDPEKRSRLNDLIDQYRSATDPSDYYDDDYVDPEEVIDMIRAEFGDKIADQVEAGADKMHFPRQGHTQWKADPLGWKKPVDRMTKAGKMFKQDSDFRKNTIKSRYKLSGKSATESVEEGSKQNLSVQQLATISDEALDKAYGYGRSNPGNTFGWQANLMSAAYAKKMIDAGVTDLEKISDAIHKGWNVTAQKFVQDPDQFDDTEKLRQAGKLEAKLQQRAKLMKINYAQLDNEEQEKDRVVARALLQAIKGQQGVAEAKFKADFKKFLESQGIEVTSEILEEGWKQKLGALGTAAAIGIGSLGGGAVNAAEPVPSQSMSTPVKVHQKTEQTKQLQKYINHIQNMMYSGGKQMPLPVDGQMGPETSKALSNVYSLLSKEKQKGGEAGKLATQQINKLDLFGSAADASLGYKAWAAGAMKESKGVAEGSGFDQEAGIGIDEKSFKFKIRDLVALADNYPVTKIDPQQFSKQIAGRDEDPTQSMARAEKADLQYPIIVVKRQNGQLWIADGTHRAHKAIMHKLPSINAKIIPIKDMAPFDVEQGVAEGQLDELKKSTVKSYADKKQAELDDVPPMPFKKPARSKAEIEKDAKGMMGALSRLSGKKPTSDGGEQGVAEGSKRPDFGAGIGDVHVVYMDGKPRRKFKREDDAIDYADDLYDRTGNETIEVQNSEGGVVYSFLDEQQSVAEGWNDSLDDPDSYEDYIDRLEHLADLNRKQDKEEPKKAPAPAELKNKVDENSSDIYDKIDHYREKLEMANEPDDIVFYSRKIKELQRELHSSKDPHDVDDPAPMESFIKKGIKQALKEGYWDDIGKSVLDFKGSELPRNYRKLDISSDSPHYKLHADEFKKDVWDQLKDKGVAVAKQAAPAKKIGGVSVTPELLLQVWRKLENVVSNVVPDGDPIDWMAPYIRKMGVDPFYTREILDKAIKRHYDKRSDYSKYLQDMWDAYGEMQGDDYKNPWK